MSYAVCKINAITKARELVKLHGRKVYVTQSPFEYLAYPDDCAELLKLTIDYVPYTLQDGVNNNQLGLLTHDASANSWPILRPRKMFPR